MKHSLSCLIYYVKHVPVKRYKRLVDIVTVVMMHCWKKGYHHFFQLAFSLVMISFLLSGLVPAGAEPGFFLGVSAPLNNGVTDW